MQGIINMAVDNKSAKFQDGRNGSYENEPLNWEKMFHLGEGMKMAFIMDGYLDNILNFFQAY